MPDEISIAETNCAEFHGKRLYPPGVIVAYTILANMPVGLILYGMNIMARGFRLYGKIVLWSGIVSGIGLGAITLYGQPPGLLFLPLNLMCGIAIYKYETDPYRKAIATGAKRARWWPPLLIVTTIMLGSYLYGWFFS